MDEQAPEWTIGELGARVADALSVGYSGPSNGQVRAVPDRRTIRYYTSLGLLDKPLAMRGRTALYGDRHLNQLVAIKRLQTRGLSLAEIQTRLAGATDSQLATLARVPNVPAKRAAKKTERGGFWKAVPREQPMPEPAAEPAAEPARPPARSPSYTPPHTNNVVRFQLAPGVSLLVDTELALTEDDIAAVSTAAQPLLHQLDIRGLLATT